MGGFVGPILLCRPLLHHIALLLFPEERTRAEVLYSLAVDINDPSVETRGDGLSRSAQDDPEVQAEMKV